MSLESMDPFESAANFNEDVGLFEAAIHPQTVDLQIPALQSIAVAWDGSDRESTLRSFADHLVARSGATVEVLEHADSEADISAALAAAPPDLLILPVPFQRDYAGLGSTSLGSLADQLLLSTPCPVLCVRQVQDPKEILAALDHVLVPVAIADELVERALGWAFRMTPPGGRIDVVAVADCDVLLEASHLISAPQTLSADELQRAMLREIGGLVSAAQQLAKTERRTMHIETRVGQFVPLTLAEMHGRPHMIIWAANRDHSSPSFHRAVDLLLASTGPVLLV